MTTIKVHDMKELKNRRRGDKLNQYRRRLEESEKVLGELKKSTNADYLKEFEEYKKKYRQKNAN
ncbi:hypothetical protein [Oceanobacillus senegalensis]|uniref:hypothetical protein n=1 Tax=Oceanobacillus senegalensis TaxID=1936063 RepID=UPI000A308B07|nr:hypothetical protein [Oceanobacillus senegalensis]